MSIVVRGVNEFGSAIAHRLYVDGRAVVIHDVPRPADCHRSMAFTDAVFDGAASLDGVTAVHLTDLAALPGALATHRTIPVVTAPLEAVLSALSPDVLIDARMRKRTQPESQIELAPLTIGVGPNFTGGRTCHLAVETGFGEDFAHVYNDRATRPVQGDPPPVLGRGRDRFVYAAHDGQFRTEHAIGQRVQTGEIVGRLGDRDLPAPFDGVLRGLVHDDTPVVAGARLFEVDPRGLNPVNAGIPARQARIAAVVAGAITRWEATRVVTP